MLTWSIFIGLASHLLDYSMSHEVEHEIELKQQIWRIEGNIIWYLMQVLYFWTYLLFGKAQNQSSHGLTGRTNDYGLANRELDSKYSNKLNSLVENFYGPIHTKIFINIIFEMII